jgi:hypothetical protein
MMKTIDHYDSLMDLFGKNREKRQDVENSKGTSKKKARTEPPKEILQRTPLNRKGSALAESSDKTVDKCEVSLFGLDELLIKFILLVLTGRGRKLLW